MSDLFNINWIERAHNDPVVQYLFKDYILEKDHLKQQTKTPVQIKDNGKKTSSTTKKTTSKVGRPRKKDSKILDAK